ncbi:hypothetical protein BGZ72_010532 [Mortierella alpina]|nr:hypothetical protein BGZ72_010532 [Mortierella alpina]
MASNAINITASEATSTNTLITPLSQFLIKSKAKSPENLLLALQAKFKLGSTEDVVRSLKAALDEAIKCAQSYKFSEILVGDIKSLDNCNNDDELISRLKDWTQVVESKSFLISCNRHFTKLGQPTPPTRESLRMLAKRKADDLTASELQVDGLILKEKDLATIGERIKVAALDLECKVEGQDFKDAHDRRIFALGASSVLDLVDLSERGQLRTVFPQKEERELLLAKFQHLSVSKNVEEPRELLAHWRVCSALSVSKGLCDARRYLLNQMAKASGHFVDDIWFLLTMVDVMINKPYLCSDTKFPDSTEGDITAALWEPLISRLYSSLREQTRIRVKIGESTMSASNKAKREYYRDTNALAFKIDARIVVDAGQDEIDLAAVEISKNMQMVKIFSDGAKVIREAKEVCDGLIRILPDDDDLLHNSIGFGIQIGGTAGTIFSVHLVAPKLYVAVKELSFNVPKSSGSMDAFTSTIRAFTWLRQVLQQSAVQVTAAMENSKMLEHMYGHRDRDEDQGRRHWSAGTWYTPSKNKARPALDLFRVPFPLKAILAAKPKASKRGGLHADAMFDESGWAVVTVDKVTLKYFNKYTGDYLDEMNGCKPTLEDQ